MKCNDKELNSCVKDLFDYLIEGLRPKSVTDMTELSPVSPRYKVGETVMLISIISKDGESTTLASIYSRLYSGELCLEDVGVVYTPIVVTEEKEGEKGTGYIADTNPYVKKGNKATPSLALNRYPDYTMGHERAIDYSHAVFDFTWVFKIGDTIFDEVEALDLRYIIYSLIFSGFPQIANKVISEVGEFYRVPLATTKALNKLIKQIH